VVAMTSSILLTVFESTRQSLERHAPYLKSDKPMHPEGDTIPTPSIDLSLSLDAKSSERGAQDIATARLASEGHRAGLLIINADDWGRDHQTTERTLECITGGTVSAVSAMVFMADSERAATLAMARGIDAGLHLNFTMPFSTPDCPARLLEHQRELVAYLRRHSLARVVFHPGLAGSFEYVVKAQLDEFLRLYGAPPDRIDGHHHMHLCANVLLGRLLPSGTLVRRNFSFRPGEKSLANRLYRKAVDYRLSRRHRLVDFLFSLIPLDPPGRLQGIFSLASASTVEVETHPINPDEYCFLLGDEILRLTANVRIGPPSAISRNGIPTPK
jgi:chitin disaccharide deacetylase